jgi:hypothetical protein
MSKGNLLTNGAKGKNFDFQFNMLRVLGKISTGVTPPVGGLATEATALSILNAIVTTQDIEILLVRDNGNGGVVVQQIVNYSSGTPTISYQDVNGAPYVPVGPLVYLDPSAVLNLMLTELLDQGLTLDNMDTTLTALNAKFGTIGQRPSAGSAPMVLSTEQELILTTIDSVLDSIDVRLTGAKRVPSYVNIAADGSTIDNVQGFCITFNGTGGTLGGTAIGNGKMACFSPNKGEDTVASIAFTVPTGGGLSVDIAYMN